MRALNTEIFPVKVGYFGTCSKPINLTSGFTIFSRNDLWRHKTAFLNRVLWRVQAHLRFLRRNRPPHVAWSVFLWRFSYRGRMGYCSVKIWASSKLDSDESNGEKTEPEQHRLENTEWLGRCEIHRRKVTVNLAFFNAFVMSNQPTWVCVYKLTIHCV